MQKSNYNRDFSEVIKIEQHNLLIKRNTKTNETIEHLLLLCFLIEKPFYCARLLKRIK